MVIALATVTLAALAQQPNLEDLQKQLDAAKKAQQDQRRRNEEAARKAAANAQNSGQPAETSGGNAQSGVDTWRDPLSDLTWIRSDNGHKINWNDARAWCAGKGTAWELPSVAELQAVYDSRANPVSCGSFECKVRAPLQLTSGWFWSRDADGASRARYVHLDVGNVYSVEVGFSVNVGALFVRRS